MPGSQEELSYTSEQKLLREQVLAALRKLDAGEISVVEFLDIIFTMGIELPEGVLKQLKLQQQSGLLDWRACVHELDGYVFKHRSLEDNTPHEMVALAKRKLTTALRGEGCLDSLSKLLFFFHRVDENGDKQLSFNEFRKAIRDFLGEQSSGRGKVTLSDADMRNLFNHFDKSGDGLLSYEEVVASLQGEVTPRRKDIIRQAFVRMDMSGVGEITLETFLDNFDVSHYPDVSSGTKTPWKALRDIEDFFQYCSTRGSGMDAVITRPDFEMFFCNISPGIDNDDDFFAVIRDMTGLSDKKPAVQNRHMTTGDTERIPLAKQSFGNVIAWDQEPSHLEHTTMSTHRLKKTVVPNFSKHPDVICWKEHKGETYDPPDNIDGINLTRTNKASGTKNLLAWQQAPARRPSNSEVRRRRDTETQAGDMFLMKGYHWSEGKMAQYGGQCPYGIDEDAKSGNPGGDTPARRSPKLSNPRSLADIMADRGI
ncbi:Capsl [Symbiodinium microadriaticum]|nr:Capsl [Symbiodinium microadriaticum]